jgi:hypothetical protein
MFLYYFQFLIIHVNGRIFDSFFKKFSLKRLKLGSIVEFFDQLGLTESKKSLAEVLKSIKVSF